MASTRKKKPEVVAQPAYAGRLASSIAALVTVQSSAELAQRVGTIAPEVDALETAGSHDVLDDRVSELEAECESWSSRFSVLQAQLDSATDRVAEHATARAAVEQELDLTRRELDTHLGLGEEGDRRDENAAVEQLERLGWTKRTSSRGRYELALIKGGDGKDYGGARILELESQIVDLIAVEVEVIGSLRRGNVLRDDETPTTPELVALLKRLRAGVT